MLPESQFMHQTFTPILAPRPVTHAPLGRSGDSVHAPTVIAGLSVRARLAPHRLGPRWLASAGADGRTKVAYLVRAPESSMGASLLLRLRRVAVARAPHALPIESIEPDSSGTGFWIVCPYTGSADGLLTLGRLLAEKHEGRMEPDEARRAASQILQSLDHSQMCRLPHGPVAMDEILVDRCGRVVIELPGIEAALQGAEPINVAGEVRSVARCVFEMLTGVQATSYASALRASGLSRAWRAWLSKGLREDGGFGSAAQALATLPSAWR